MKKLRLDKLLVSRGLCSDQTQAQSLIMDGRVLVAGIPNSKAGSQVAVNVDVRLKPQDDPYVSRGALKLVGGLDAFGIDPTGWTCLDVGASTGGFTDVLLRRGATRVYAVDVGYGQLDWSLQSDDRVVVLDRENIRHLSAEKVPDACSLAVIDVSFISLTSVLPKVAELLSPASPVIALIKPQFEAKRHEVGEGGVVRDTAIRESTISKVQLWATDAGFTVGDTVESPIKGPAGNVEFLQLLHTPG